MPRRNSSRVKPIRKGGKDAISLEYVSDNRLSTVPADPAMEFDWRAFFEAIGFRSDERAFLERKQMGHQQAADTEAVRARVARRLKRAKSSGLRRSDFENPVRGGDSRHLVYAETLPKGRKVLALSRLDATFAQIMGAEFQNIFVDSRTKRATLGGSSRSREIMDHSTKLELKFIDPETGVFEGLLSTYGNIDAQNETFERGAFTKTLREGGDSVPLLLNHNINQQVGVLRLQDDSSALIAHGKFNLGTQLGRDSYSTLLFNKSNHLKVGLSVGFLTIKDTVKDGVRRILEAQLGEGSLTLFPANPLALVSTVKSIDDQRNQEISHLLTQLRESYKWKWPSQYRSNGR